MKKIKIAFVLPPSALPIPAMKGGAIETLLTMLLYENEKMGKYEFVFIVPDEKEQINSWKHSKVYGLSEGGSGEKFPYDHKANRIVKEEAVDYLIMEGGARRMDGCFRETVRKDRLAIHLHHAFLRKGIYNDAFGVTIAPSRFIANSWNKEDPENQRRTYILKNSIDVDKFNCKISVEERNEMRGSLGFSQEDFVVIFCGRLIQGKGVKELLQAVLLIPKPNLKLLLVGSDSFKNGNKGIYSREVVEIAEQNKEKITYIGYVDNEKMSQMYQCADLQVIPSLLEEAFCLVALEAMCSGLPLIYTNSGGMPEIVPHNAGIMVRKEDDIVGQLADKIQWILEHPLERMQMSKAACEHTQHYSQKQYYLDFGKMIDWWGKL